MMKYQWIKLSLLSSLVFISLSAIGQSNKLNGAEQDERGKRRGPPPFCVLDINSDGGITLEEFKQHKIPQGDHETIFSNIDGDNNGVISELELASHKPPRNRRSKRQNK